MTMTVEREQRPTQQAVKKPRLVLEPHPGKAVNYFADYKDRAAGKPGSAAIIQEVTSYGTVKLAIWGSQNVYTKDGIRHADDPFLADNPNQRMNNGVWDYTPFDKKLAELLG